MEGDLQMKAELELQRILAEAQKDFDNGRVAPMDVPFAAIRSTLT